MSKRVLKEYASVWDALLRGGDALLVVLTGWLAAVVYLGKMPNLPGYGMALVLAVLLVLVLFPIFELYQSRRGGRIWDEVRAVTLAWFSVMGALTLIAFLAKQGLIFSRGWFLVWVGLGWAGLLVERYTLRFLLRALRRRGFNWRRIVIVRNGRLGVEVALGIEAASWTGLKVAALFCPAGADCRCAEHAARLEGVENVEGLDDLAGFVERERIDQVWIALPLKEEDAIRRVLYELRHSSVSIQYVPDISGLCLLSHPITDVAGFPVLNLAGTHMDGFNNAVKMVEDRVLAALILLLVSPLMLAIAVGVKLSSPGPVLFRQKRLGLAGEQIMVLKFRSMKLHEDSHGQVSQATKGDPRVTRFGAFLRRTSLDELPQFFNVLRGEMSIVGPRPHAIEHNEIYKELIDKYMLRHLMKPGITGWAQVNGFRGETNTLDKMVKRVEHDLYYIENWSFWLDLKIIALTVVRGFANPNAY